jgi:hypothetical protein
MTHTNTHSGYQPREPGCMGGGMYAEAGTVARGAFLAIVSGTCTCAHVNCVVNAPMLNKCARAFC